jgi:anti-anti-sigma factor
MAIIKERRGRVMRLSLKGAMALGMGGGALRREVVRALETGARRIIVDASGVRYLDAAGLGELVACRALVREAGASFRLRGAFGKVLEMLRLTGLDRLLVGARVAPEAVPRVAHAASGQAAGRRNPARVST